MPSAVTGIVRPGSEANGRFGAGSRIAMSFLRSSASHLVNDMMQSLLLSIYPILKGEFTLGFAQLGMITLTYQITASLPRP
jgi:FSR family fosmidomycin resistance protein-like MFS transporter